MDAIGTIQAAQAGAGGLNAPRATGAATAEVRAAAEAFTAQFVGQMFQMATRDLPVDDMFGGGPGEKMFRDMLTEEWAASAVKSGGVGIADAVMRQIIQMQGEQAS